MELLPSWFVKASAIWLESPQIALAFIFSYFWNFPLYLKRVDCGQINLGFECWENGRKACKSQAGDKCLPFPQVGQLLRRKPVETAV